MDNIIYKFDNYFDILLDFVGPPNKRTGLRLQLAQALNCQSAYISKVLKGNSHLSLEQAQKAANFMGLDKSSAHYFLLLVHKDRAGTSELKSYYQDQIIEIQEERKRIIHRLSQSTRLPEQFQAKYYSSWLYLAVHIGVSIPELSNPKALSKYFNKSLNDINEVISFLLDSGLIVQEKHRLNVGPVQVHLPDNSEHILRHQNNWRLQALKSLDSKRKGDLHYSVTSVLSKKDAELLYENYLLLIKKQREITAPSKEETMYCSIIDFFKV